MKICCQSANQAQSLRLRTKGGVSHNYRKVCALCGKLIATTTIEKAGGHLIFYTWLPAQKNQTLTVLRRFIEDALTTKLTLIFRSKFSECPILTIHSSDPPYINRIDASFCSTCVARSHHLPSGSAGHPHYVVVNTWCSIRPSGRVRLVSEPEWWSVILVVKTWSREPR